MYIQSLSQNSWLSFKQCRLYVDKDHVCLGCLSAESKQHGFMQRLEQDEINTSMLCLSN